MKKTLAFSILLLLGSGLYAQSPVHVTTCAKFWKNDAPIPYYWPTITTPSLGAVASVTYPLNGYQDGCLNVEVSLSPDDPNTLVKTFLERDDTSSCLNGISINDLVEIRRHILGIASLPLFGIIAADVNRSGSVTTLDMVLISKLLLGIYEVFPGVSDWRFFPKEMVFTSPTNPFSGTQYPQYPFGSLEGDTLNFVGIRTGDVDGDANPSLPCSLRPIADSLTLSLPEMQLPADVPVLVPVTLSGDFSVAGFQMEFALDQSAVKFNKFVKGIQEVPANTYTEKNGQLRIVVLNDYFLQPEPVLQAGQALFYMELTANKPVNLADVLHLDQSGFQAQLIKGGTATKIYALQERYSPIVVSHEVLTNRFSAEAIPNPFTNSTQITLTLEQSETVLLEVSDLSGRVTYRQSSELPAGKQVLTVPGASLQERGIGTYRVVVGNKVATGKLMRL